MNKTAIILVSLLSLLSLGAFIKGIDFVSTTDSRVTKHPLVYVVDKNLLSTKIHFGVSPMCGITPCWLLSDHLDNAWKSVTLPKFNFRSDRSVQFSKDDKLYYRMRLKIPKELLDSKESIVFSPLSISLSKFKIYINDVLVQSLDGRSSKAGFVYISIPKEYISNEEVFIGVEGIVKPGDNGIFSFMKMLVGPNTEIASLTKHSERVSVSNHLLWTLTIGTLFVLFSMIYVFTNKRQNYVNVLVFSFSMLVIQMMKSEILGEVLSIPFRLWFIIMARLIASSSILFYLLDSFRIKKYFYVYRFVSIFSLIAGTIVSILFYYEVTFVTIKLIFDSINIFYFLCVLIPLLQGFQDKRINGGHKVFLIYFLILHIFLSLAGNLFYLNLLDLIICLYIATLAVLGMAKDERTIVRQIVELEEKARDAAIGQTAAHLAHDIRKPFSQMSSILNSFHKFAQDKVLLKKAKREVESSVIQVNTMVDQILDFTREGEGSLETHQLHDVLLQTLVSLRNNDQFDQSKVALEYNLNSKYMILANIWEIQRVFSNIISNALEAILVMAGSTHGRIRFTSEDIVIDDQKYVRIKIINNNGPQIPSDKIDSLFTPFFTSGKSRGTGLGLASVKKIVTRHKGNIKAYNLISTQEVCFEITLLAASELESYKIEELPNFLVADEEVVVNTSSLASMSILVLEDQEVYSNFLKDKVQELNLETTLNLNIVKSYNDAISAYSSNSYDVIISDIDLSEEKSGLDFLNDIELDSKVFILSNHSRSDEILKNLSFEYTFLEKPLKFELLLRSLLENDLPENDNLVDMKKLYYCDDSEIMRFYFESLIENWNKSNPQNLINLRTFDKGEDLLKEVTISEPDFIVSDNHMEDSGGVILGVDLLLNLKKDYPDLPVALVSNHIDSKLKGTFENLSKVSFMKLPLEEETLFTFIEENLP
ncbi:hypothetical protein A9Q84_17015 [Halobacteriovorax marinus]|uniref:histidine kinase n=1 Tax=Halobacteriovorax marinus TaxID=97084 RepID=A0A1Y5F3V5_9BACT|nr:hypothetical protein A9Q84_17015 [Halobacteriovorax marinus]